MRARDIFLPLLPLCVCIVRMKSQPGAADDDDESDNGRFLYYILLYVFFWM